MVNLRLADFLLPLDLAAGALDFLLSVAGGVFLDGGVDFLLGVLDDFDSGVPDFLAEGFFAAVLDATGFTGAGLLVDVFDSVDFDWLGLAEPDFAASGFAGSALAADDFTGSDLLPVAGLLGVDLDEAGLPAAGFSVLEDLVDSDAGFSTFRGSTDSAADFMGASLDDADFLEVLALGSGAGAGSLSASSAATRSASR